MSDIEPADPRARRLALLIVGIGLLAGLLLFAAARAGRPAFEDWVRDDPRSRLRLVLAVTMAVTLAPVLAMSAYMWRLGARTIDAERFPPPGRRVTRDVPLLSGGAARRRGRGLKIVAGGLAAGAAAIGLLFWRLLAMLDRLAD